jgi:CRP-like cAMP-binding protein
MVAIRGIEELLAEIDLFNGLDTEARTLIAGCAKNEQYRAESFIFREGQPANRFYVIRHGKVAIEVHVPGKEPIVLETVQGGDVLGWSWIAPPYRWSFDAKALEQTRVIGVDAECLRNKCEQDPALGFTLYRSFIPVVAQRLQSARIRLIDIYGHPDG